MQKLWLSKALAWCKQRLTVHSHGCLETTKRDSRSQHEVSQVNNDYIRNQARGHLCDTLAKNTVALCQCSEDSNEPEYK